MRRLFLRTYGADDNAPGDSTSGFVGIPQPVGVQNGDVVFVGIMLPSSGITITPPDDSWILVTRTDPNQAFGIAVYQHVALNDGPHYVFALSSSIGASGVCVVYGGIDLFTPFETSAYALTNSSTTHNTPAITVPDNDEELVLFMGADNTGTYTPSTGYLDIATATRSQSTIDVQHKPVASAQSLVAGTSTFSTSANGVGVLLCLRPTVGKLSPVEAYGRIIEMLPPGIEQMYDLTPTGDYYKFFFVLGIIFKIFCFDLLDLARREIVPNQTKNKLPDWERIFGLTAPRSVRTIPQRQAAVLAAWRLAAGGTITEAVLQSIINAALGYLPDTTLQIVRASRSALTSAHSYNYWGGDLSVPNLATTSCQFFVPDGGVVSDMGAQLILDFNTPMSSGSVVLTAPDGTVATWSPISGNWNAATFQLSSPVFTGKSIYGLWTLTVNNTSGGSCNLLHSGTTLFVEGTARNQETGGAIFDWGVYADPAHLAENGVSADFITARALLQKLKRSHTCVNLLQSLTPYPNEDSGVHASIPDECIPT